MASSEGNGGHQPAGWKAADGKLWFPTIKGVVAIDPQTLNRPPLPVIIEEVKLDRQRFIQVKRCALSRDKRVWRSISRAKLESA